MLRLLIRKEILSHILSLRFGVTFILFITLVFAGIYVAVNEYELEVQRYGSRVRLYRDKLADILAEEQEWGGHGWIPRLFWNEGKSDAVPVPELSWMGAGLQSVTPAGIRTTEDSTENIDRGLTRNPLLGLLQMPDFVYMVNVILSLLAILFMFDAICGEKETGTLRLMLSNSVGRHLILLSKWIGGYIVLLVPFVLATGGGIGYAWATGVFEVNSDNMVRIAVLFALACLYIAVFFNLSLFVSATTHNSATALLVCVLLWVIFTLAVPNLAPVTAKILEPEPALQKIHAEKRAIDEEIELEKRRLTLTSGELGYGKKIEDERDKLDKKRKRLHRQWDDFYERACERQRDMAQTFGRLSPSASWIYAATALTDTGPAAYGLIQDGAKRVSSSFDECIRTFWRSPRDPQTDRRARFEAEQLPSLKLSFPTAKQAIAMAIDDVLLLAIANVVFFMLAFAFFLRYDVR